MTYTHATKRAIAMLAGKPIRDIPQAQQACDGEYGLSAQLVGTEAIEEGSTHLPDCPQCAVLWDEALCVTR